MVNSELAKSKSFVDNFKGEKPLILSNKTNYYYVNSYLAEVKKRSDGAYRNHKSALKSLFENIDKPVHEIYMWDIIDYFKDVLNPKDVKHNYKETRRSYLKSFFEYVRGQLAAKKVNYTNPVPNHQIYKFLKRESDIKKKSEKNEKLLSKHQILEILEFCKKNFTRSKKVFIYFGLCVSTGARFSEIRTMRIEDVNLKERFFETGFEKNAMKSTMRSDESLMFFFTKTFKIYLENYMIPLQEKNQKYLFPSPNKKESPISNYPIQYYYEKIRNILGFHFSMHHFRHSMITHLKRNGCSLEDREMLLNHTPSSVQGKHYEHDEIEEKRAVFDKYFPYYSFPYF